MKKIKENRLVVIAYAGLIIAILSAFTTIVGYTNTASIHKTFSVINLLADAEGFGSFIFDEYIGKAYVIYHPWQLLVLIALGVIAIVCAFTGLIKLSKQTDNKHIVCFDHSWPSYNDGSICSSFHRVYGSQKSISRNHFVRHLSHCFSYCNDNLYYSSHKNAQKKQ